MATTRVYEIHATTVPRAVTRVYDVTMAGPGFVSAKTRIHQVRMTGPLGVTAKTRVHGVVMVGPVIPSQSSMYGSHGTGLWQGVHIYRSNGTNTWL